MSTRLGPPLYYLPTLFDLTELQNPKLLQEFVGILRLFLISIAEPAITDFWDKNGINPRIHIRTLSPKPIQVTDDNGEM